MGLLDTLDNLVHGGVEKPESYERKKSYIFGEQLGNWLRFVSKITQLNIQ
jgi:calcium/calmodulin-dependent protein kinase I